MKLGTMYAIMALHRGLKKVYGSARKNNHAVRVRALRARIEEARKRDSVAMIPKTAIALLAQKATPELIDINAGPAQENDNTEQEFYDPSNGPRFDDDASGAEQADREQIDRPSEWMTDDEPREIDDQGIREGQYIVFVSAETPEAYTAGPSRIVEASDGVQDCAALLLTLDLSAKVRRAVEAQRDFARREQASADRMEVTSRFRMAITSEMTRHESRLADLEDEEEPDQAKIASLREELDVLGQMREAVKVEIQQEQNMLESRGSNVRMLQGHVMACLEDAFRCANLLEEEEEQPRIELEPRNVKQEYEAFRRRLEDAASDDFITPLETRSDDVQFQPQNMTDEERARQDLANTFWEARERLQEAQHNFDNIEYWKECDREASNRAFERGEHAEYATPEDFDLHWIKRGQGMTRELREAEEAFSVVLANLREAGIDVESEHAVETGGDCRPGRPSVLASSEPKRDGMGSFNEHLPVAPQAEEMPGEHDGMRLQNDFMAVLRPKVTKWLDDVSNPLSPGCMGEAPEVDEWGIRDVEIGDSISAVAQGQDRKRIDRWQGSLDIV